MRASPMLAAGEGSCIVSRPAMNRRVRRHVVAVATSMIVVAGCNGSPSRTGASAAADVRASIEEQERQFPRGVIEVTGGVHVAVGYGLANSVMIVGDGGV